MVGDGSGWPPVVVFAASWDCRPPQGQPSTDGKKYETKVVGNSSSYWSKFFFYFDVI